jgi:hypothetical protein
MGKKSSKPVKGRSGSIATVIQLSDRRRLGTCMHGKQFGSADILAFPLQRLDKRRPRGRRDTSAFLPLLNCRTALADFGRHFRERFPGIKKTVDGAHNPKYASDELSAQEPIMIPMTSERAGRTICPTMGRNVTPVKFRAEMAKRLESARRVAGYETKRQAADRLGIGLDRYE